MNRDQLIRTGVIVPHEDLHDMYRDGVPAPNWSQPWHRDDPGLRLDARGLFYADVDVKETIEVYGAPMSMAAARRMLP